ncbi:hypothetical protein [Flaviaesturariibacter amylovorans]|uniref:Uncharacterized protein n=1 Tax=Flaviaesturariibacter amylovorans TaxID=1084520 RepID=A0ABP8HT55_9BACT
MPATLLRAVCLLVLSLSAFRGSAQDDLLQGTYVIDRKGHGGYEERTRLRFFGTDSFELQCDACWPDYLYRGTYTLRNRRLVLHVHKPDLPPAPPSRAVLRLTGAHPFYARVDVEAFDTSGNRLPFVQVAVNGTDTLMTDAEGRLDIRLKKPSALYAYNFCYHGVQARVDGPGRYALQLFLVPDQWQRLALMDYRFEWVLEVWTESGFHSRHPGERGTIRWRKADDRP